MVIGYRGAIAVEELSNQVSDLVGRPVEFRDSLYLEPYALIREGSGKIRVRENLDPLCREDDPQSEAYAYPDHPQFAVLIELDGDWKKPLGQRLIEHFGSDVELIEE